jgi:quinone-modifying oxidoreductase subunit QmoC
MADESVENKDEAAQGTEEEAQAAEETTDVAPGNEGTGEVPPDEAGGEETRSGEDVSAEEEEAEAGPATVMEKEAVAVKPDIKFVKQIMGSGGGDLKKCYQCATCSVVCNLTPDENPFPRKEMQWAQWGLKEKLMGSPDIWLCHQCSDCVAQCPRDAKPGKVLQAVAKMTIANYSIGGVTRALGNIGGTILMAIIPIAVILIAIAAQGNFSGVYRPDGEIVYSEFMDIYRVIDPIYTLAAIFAVVMFVIGGRKYWGDMVSRHTSAGGDKPAKGFFANLGPTLSELLAHRRFRECDETKDRANAHLLVFYAFLGLALTTAWAVLYIDFLGIESPFSFANPIKWLGNVSAAAGIIGIIMVIIYRFAHSEKLGMGSYFDWLLILTILLILATGIGAEMLRVADVASAAYTVYAIHLMSILFLFIYAPFSKMAHMIYRLVALVFARATGRDIGVGM